MATKKQLIEGSFYLVDFFNTHSEGLRSVWSLIGCCAVT